MTGRQQAALAYVRRNGLREGTHPENIAAMRLDQWGIRFVQQHPVGRYRLDFAVLGTLTAIEIDGPHHMRPDVAHRDAIRDATLRDLGWVVMRVTVGPGNVLDTPQLIRAARVAQCTCAG